MQIKGSNFSENIMITAAYAKMQPSAIKPSTIKMLELKVYFVLDALFSFLSEGYRIRKTEICNKIKKGFEDRICKTISKVAEDLVLFKETLKTPETTRELPPEEKQEAANVKDEEPSVLRDPSEETVSDSLGETTVDSQVQTINDSPEEVNSMDGLNAIDVEHLSETSERIEEIAREYNELIAERKAEEELVNMKQYLMENPGALAGFLLGLQMMMAEEQETIEEQNEFPEFISEMDVDHLSDTADTQLERRSEEDLTKFNEYLIENPGMFTAFLLMLQVYVKNFFQPEDLEDTLVN